MSRRSLLILLLIIGCVSSDLEQDSSVDAKFVVQGPVEIDTTFRGSSYAPYEKYILKIKNLSKNIFIPVYNSKNAYMVASYVAMKEINPDSFLTGGGIVDYVTDKVEFLKAGKEYEFPFFLTQFDFTPDTIFIDFKYFTDSLLTERNFIEVPFSDYKPLPHFRQ